MSNARNLARLLPNASGQLPPANLVGGKVLQVVQYVLTTLTAGTNNLDSGANNFADSGLAVTITPTYASSKILISGSIATSANQTYERVAKRLVRGSTPVLQGTPVGNRGGTIDGSTRNSGYALDSTSFVYQDSPNTTSPTTYKLQLATAGGGTVTWYVNHTSQDGDNNVYALRGVSVITAMEIAA